MGAIAGAAVAAAGGQLAAGAAAGIVGAVLGTLVGAATRARLAQAFGRDLPAALLEDAVAVVGAGLILALSSRLVAAVVASSRRRVRSASYCGSARVYLV